MTGVVMVLAGSGGLALSCGVNTTSILASRTGSGLLTSGSVTATGSGGYPGYTYSWAYVNGDSFTITNPTGATTSFQKTMVGVQDLIGNYQCTVTDTASGHATSALVNVEMISN